MASTATTGKKSPLWLRDTEEHGYQFASKSKAQMLARIETQRTGVKHTHYLTTTYRDLCERICWTVIPVSAARAALRA